MHPIPLNSLWFMSLNDLWILLTKIKLKVNQCVAPALHVSYGWLAYVLFHAYHLDACEQKFLGKHAYLSSWRLRYGLNDMVFTPYCLSAREFLFWKFVKPLQSSSLICQSPTKAIWCFSLKILYTYAACLALSFVKLLWPLREIFIMVSWSRFACTPYTPCYASLRS